MRKQPMKQLTFQFPTQELRKNSPAVQMRTLKNQQPVTWHMNESEASFLSDMLSESLTFSTERSVI